MTPNTPPSLAVVGSGPAGCYLAQSFLRAFPESEITLFDALVSPFGLVRYGVAADHQHTKAITRQFERLFAAPNVRFAGDVTVGRDLTLAELRAHYDAVVLATGLSADRALPIPGGELPGVIGAGALTRALNAHPAAATRLPELGPDVVIIGAGNVALDILRFLVKDRGGYAASDIADPVLDAYLAAPAQRITVLSRSAARAAKGDPQMLRELAALPRGSYAAPGSELDPAPDDDRAAAARSAAIAELVAAERPHFPGPAVTLRFGATPTEILGDGHVAAVVCEAGGAQIRIPATAVITAIGFDAETAALASSHATPETGRVAAGLYRTGWAKRGPRGAIPENRACAKAVADEIAADLASGALAPDPRKTGFAGLPAAVRARAISYAQWGALDAHERATAAPDRVRAKLTDHDQMAAIARGGASSPSLP
ncbi:FAD-dependent oxidoreductase [Leucobacter luti]|uniref:ferredoxin--NADP(+) reductase n=1 Tax=Leucobacter luti TaxID=340320 RepID=A0A4Q7U0E2_9MICO|nr:FAD-dependent oxidoreductase [Leucobacter luti]MBL3698603.1 hypothetical protein [Leucobacter luti]RZT65978.1 ferredoxin--NADP+ reductase [Leucobacter luti]